MEYKISNHIEIGKIGENIACSFLEKRGYKVIERNFKRKWGEIDIVCSKKESVINLLSSTWNNVMGGIKNVLRGTSNKKLVFVEVKTLKNNQFLKPEDNLTANKQRKLIRTCQLYISEKNIDPDIEWRIDAVLITLDTIRKKAKVKHLKGAIY
ncbi:MAG: YraN family protein [Patescibacteria group bacterium]